MPEDDNTVLVPEQVVMRELGELVRELRLLVKVGREYLEAEIADEERRRTQPQAGAARSRSGF